jgi:hypothetical protein
MDLILIKYNDYLNAVPLSGNVILAQQTETQILVYQAFNHHIANFVVENQRFGGNHYGFSRMSWIKPNFLWMMYRCGWAEKLNQERVLGIWMNKTDFDTILENAAYSSYKSVIYENQEDWKQDLANKPVRLQWDPDHDIYGQKQERRAIQLGLKGAILEQFNQEMITKIIDVTDFVKTQKQLIMNKLIHQLEIPKEWIYQPKYQALCTKLGI